MRLGFDHCPVRQHEIFVKHLATLEEAIVPILHVYCDTILSRLHMILLEKLFNPLHQQPIDLGTVHAHRSRPTTDQAVPYRFFSGFCTSKEECVYTFILDCLG